MSLTESVYGLDLIIRIKTIFVNGIGILIFVTAICCVFFEVRTTFLNTVYMSAVFYRVNTDFAIKLTEFIINIKYM
jgi:hypothetical protein